VQHLSRRNKLISEHAGLARRIALQLARRCPTSISREDLIAAGMLGLTEAATRYDEASAEPFVPFAAQRIRGAILDELRRGDPLTPHARQLARKVKAAIRELERSTGEAPSAQAIADALGVSLEAYRADLARLVDAEVRSLDERGAPEPAGDQLPVDEDAARRHLLAKVRAALHELDPHDVALLSLHYVEERTFQEIASSMRITLSCAFKRLRRAVERLRERLSLRLRRGAPASGEARGPRRLAALPLPSAA
jgi:RNA polymerase sigma factor for flagellar operon FliA